MTKMLNDLEQFMLGAPNIHNWLSTFNPKDYSYPPYNIVKEDEDTYHLEIALAGMTKDDVKITSVDDRVTVSMEKQETTDLEFVHRGISTRRFERSFLLGEHCEVESANMENGLLTITVKRIVPEQKQTKLIEIK